MTTRHTTIFFLLITTVLSIALGACITFIVQMYNVAEKNLVLETAYYKRIITIDYIDLERGLIGATTVDRDIARMRNIVFAIDEKTVFQAETPILEGDVIVGYTPATRISPTAIQTGDEAFVWLITLPDGRLYSSEVLVGRPFTRP